MTQKGYFSAHQKPENTLRTRIVQVVYDELSRRGVRHDYVRLAQQQSELGGVDSKSYLNC